MSLSKHCSASLTAVKLARQCFDNETAAMINYLISASTTPNPNPNLTLTLTLTLTLEVREDIIGA